MGQLTRNGFRGRLATSFLPFGILLVGALRLHGEPAAPLSKPEISQPTVQSQPTIDRQEATSPSQAQAKGTGAPDTTREIPVPPGPPAFQFTKVDLELLRQVEGFDKYIDEEGWVYDDPAINAYLEKVGMSLVPSESLENVKWRFRVLRDLQVNAFALPNGSVYVKSGLISRLDNEAQLAGVLAHEIAHVVNRDSYVHYRDSRGNAVATELVVSVVSGFSPMGVGPAIAVAMGTRMPALVTEVNLGYRSNFERDADLYALDRLVSKGYGFHEYIRGFELLQYGPEVDLAQDRQFWSNGTKLRNRLESILQATGQLKLSAAGLPVNQKEFRSATSRVIRENARLAMTLGQPRTAVMIAQRLSKEEPDNAENYDLLGDAYRSLGARTLVPESTELTREATETTRKRLRNMTIEEYDKVLLADPQGAARWKANADQSEQAFRKALEIDPGNADAHRGLGFLFEKKAAFADAITEFGKYLELAPHAKDARLVRMHIDSAQQAVEQAPNTGKSRNAGSSRVQ